METLYHYTTGAGLKGIIDSKTYWASDYRFLNDASEFTFGLSIITAEIHRYQNDIKISSPDGWLLLSSLIDSVTKTGVVALVASFTTQGDLLSQWRGYNNGKGYSIGIDSDWLNGNADAQGFKLFPVSYEEEAQYKSADAALRLLLTMIEEIEGDPKRIHGCITNWWTHALKVALAFKDKNFSEEQEWRLAYVSRHWPSGIQVRPGPIGLIPYVPYSFDKVIIDNPIYETKNRGLQHIVVGPALRDQQLAAVDALLASHHMRFKITKSAIPYVAD